MKQKFRDVKLGKEGRAQLDLINQIIAEYQADGYRLTLRQLYYQLVVRNVIVNREQSYKRLSELLKEGRMGGIVDWSAIVDRLRRPSKPPCWDNPADIIEACVKQYRENRMEGQAIYLEVWVEKDALSEVLERVTSKYGINICVNRGYSSVSAMYDAYLRFRDHRNVTILYLGDHDPSGIDMIRDVNDRIVEFLNGDKRGRTKHFEVVPVALTREQIEEHEPPPNPAKTTDARYVKYEEQHGSSSWEVDALDARVLDSILTAAIESYIDRKVFNAILSSEKDSKRRLIGAQGYIAADDTNYDPDVLPDDDEDDEDE